MSFMVSLRKRKSIHDVQFVMLWTNTGYNEGLNDTVLQTEKNKKNFVTGKFTIHHDVSAQLQMLC